MRGVLSLTTTWIIGAALPLTASMGQSPAAPVSSAEARITDQTISDKIEDELAADAAVSAPRIDVETADGIVTLSGVVGNLLAKDRAQRIAEAVKGVRAVINRIEVIPTTTPADTELAAAVEAALARDAATESYEIAVSAEDGAITLTGRVDSWQEKELAATVAKGVSGVKALNNQLTVEYPEERTDDQIREEIERALRWSVYVDDAQIDVAVEEGEVQLSGTVGSATEKALAKMEAWVAGVSAVDASALEVARGARDPLLREDKFVVKNEEELEEAILDALRQHPRVAAFNVTPVVAGSLVTLRGTVENLQAKRAAAEVARGTVGVSEVINRLRVRPERVVRDGEAETSIRNALRHDPYVDRFDIIVDVINGTAHLYGDVDTRFEKVRAENKASRVYGVVDVENHLRVDTDRLYTYDPYVDYGDDYFEEDYPARPTARYTRADAEIKKGIIDELFWSPFVDSEDVTVSVDDGVATLAGSVDSRPEQQAAIENAYEGGALFVVNELVIENLP